MLMFIYSTYLFIYIYMNSRRLRKKLMKMVIPLQDDPLAEMGQRWEWVLYIFS